MSAHSSMPSTAFIADGSGSETESSFRAGLQTAADAYHPGIPSQCEREAIFKAPTDPEYVDQAGSVNTPEDTDEEMSENDVGNPNPGGPSESKVDPASDRLTQPHTSTRPSASSSRPAPRTSRPSQVSHEVKDLAQNLEQKTSDCHGAITASGNTIAILRRKVERLESKHRQIYGTKSSVPSRVDAVERLVIQKFAEIEEKIRDCVGSKIAVTPGHDEAHNFLLRRIDQLEARLPKENTKDTLARRVDELENALLMRIQAIEARCEEVDAQSRQVDARSREVEAKLRKVDEMEHAAAHKADELEKILHRLQEVESKARQLGDSGSFLSRKVEEHADFTSREISYLQSIVHRNGSSMQTRLHGSEASLWGDVHRIGANINQLRESVYQQSKETTNRLSRLERNAARFAAAKRSGRMQGSQAPSTLCGSTYSGQPGVPTSDASHDLMRGVQGQASLDEFGSYEQPATAEARSDQQRSLDGIEGDEQVLMDGDASPPLQVMQAQEFLPSSAADNDSHKETKECVPGSHRSEGTSQPQAEDSLMETGIGHGESVNGRSVIDLEANGNVNTMLRNPTRRRSRRDEPGQKSCLGDISLRSTSLSDV